MKSTNQSFFRILILGILLLAAYSKMLGLPVALAIQSGPGPGERGDLLVLLKTANTSDRLVCVDSLNSACAVLPVERVPKAADSYGVIAVLPAVMTASLIIGVLAGVVVFMRGAPLVYTLVVLAILLNGLAVSMPYIDQSRIYLNIEPPAIGSKKPYVDIRNMEIALNLGLVRDGNVTCQAEGRLIDAGIVDGRLEIGIPHDIIAEKLESVNLSKQLTGIVPISVYIPYSCIVLTDTGVLVVNGSVEVTIRPLKIFFNNETVLIENPNPIQFNITLIVISSNTVNSSTYTIPAGGHIEVRIPSDYDKVYIRYEYFGRMVSLRVS